MSILVLINVNLDVSNYGIVSGNHGQLMAMGN